MQSVSDGRGKRLKLCLFVFGLLGLLCCDYGGFTAEAEDTNGVLRSRAFKFNNITSRQARDMLSQLHIGKSYDELSDQVLIVTSDRGTDLIKATEVLSVLDQPRPVGYWVLLAGSAQQPLPDIDVLGTQIPSLTVGTLMEAPPKGSKNPVILDIVDNKLIAIAAEDLLPVIQKAVEAWKTANPPRPAEPNTLDVQPPTETVQPEAETETGEQAGPTDQSAQETAGEQALQARPAVDESMSLQEMMSRLMEAQDQQPEVPLPTEKPSKGDVIEKDIVTDDLMGMLETEPNSTEDYMSDELLKSLLEEEKKTTPKQPVVTAPEPAVEPAVKPQPEVAVEPQQQPKSEAEKLIEKTPQGGEEKTLQEAIQMLMKAQQEEKAKAAQAQEPVEPAQPQTAQQPEATEPSARSEAVSENLRLQREMAILRQRLADMEAQKSAAGGKAVNIEPEAKVTPKIITEDQKDSTQTQFEKAIGDKELETVIDLPQEVELENLVDLVGKQLGLNYMYDPAIFRGQKVFLKIHEGKIKVKDLYRLLESVLRFRGFVMTRRDNFVTVIKSQDANQVASQVDTVFRMPGDPIQPGDIIVSTIFQLDNIDANTAQQTLTGMKLGMSNGFQQIAETNTLIVTDYSYRMPRIEEVLQMIDVPGEEKVFKYRSLKFMQAADLVTKLKDLVSQMEGVSMQVSTTPTPSTTPTRYTTRRVRNPQTGRIETQRVPVQTEQGGGAAAAAGGTPDQETVFIDTDERTNRVLMIGTQAQIDIINQLIDTLDVPQHNLKFVREYVIQNVEAIEVVNVLNELGLAQLQVSDSGGSSAEAARSAAARRAAAARAQPNQPQPQSAASSTPSVSGGGAQPNIAIRPATNSLLVNGTEEQHQAIELVIAHVDVVQKDQRTIREYEIQYVDTQEIIDTMMDLGIISSAPSSGGYGSQSTSRTATTRGRTSRTTRSTQQQATPEGGAQPQALTGLAGEEGAAEDITAQEPQISVLEATNSLLVYATPRQHKAISLLIAHADRVPETTTTPYVVYALENQDPVELAEVLTKLIQETVEEVGATSTPTDRIQTARPAGNAGGTANVPTLEEQDIKIIPDEPSYSLIVYANKRNQQWIAELIDELDEYRPQVLLDCTLVEVTKDDAFKFEIDLVSKTYSDLDLRPGTTGSLGGTGTTIGNLGGSSSFLPSTYGHASSGAGTFTGFFNTDMVQALLTAMQKNEYGRIMARPKILVNDNQEGEIKTEDIQAVAQITTNVIPGTATQTSTAAQDVSFTDYTAGVTLTIKPHISKGDMLRLEITLNRTDFGTTSKTIPVSSGVEGVSATDVPYPPDRTTTDITTVSTIPDGTTIILGGLEKLKQGKLQSKVPILGDLPLVGGLFRDVNDTDTQGKLYVFVKANILRPSDQIGGLQDIRRVSDKYRRQFEQMESEFQGMQDWPGIDAEPMDPLQVLELDKEASVKDKNSLTTTK